MLGKGDVYTYTKILIHVCSYIYIPTFWCVYYVLKILSIEATESLLNFVPTPEETAVMKEFINSGMFLFLVALVTKQASLLVPVSSIFLSTHLCIMCLLLLLTQGETCT